ncbi:MAG TPA: hypothetical protein VI704_03715, partial [Bacteroidota bacterium]|nr:hypothetical protein [Bacteroidota bacterium]
MIKRFIIFVVFIGSVLVLSNRLFAQEITVNGGNQTLTITTGSPGAEPLPVVNTAATLTYKK